MSLPYYKRFPRDFLDGCIGMSLEVKGAYAVVLDLIYMRDGKLPDDERYIAGQLGCSVRKWNSIKSELIQRGKLVVESGFISNFRADFLLEETRKYRDKQAEIAAKPRKNNTLRQPDRSQSEPEPDTTEAKAPVVSTRPKKRDIAEGFLAFWQAYPLKKGKDAAAKAFAKALTRIEEPDPLSIILAGIERCQREWDDPKYIPHPATWLNQGRWADEETPQPTNAPRARHERPYRSNRAEQRDVWADILAESAGPHPGGAEPLRIEGGLHEGA